jgi:hypothetical protein
MIIPANSMNKYLPITINYVIDNDILKLAKHTFYAYNARDYPLKVSNLVVTAIKIK